MKIFNKNIQKGKSKLVNLRKNSADLGEMKYLPSYTKEWKNTIYSFNQNVLKNIPVNNFNINKIIQSYFNLYFKNNEFIQSKTFKEFKLKNRRNSLKRIFVSNAEIKYTNSKAVITLYVVNREKNVLLKKYLNLNEIMSKDLLNSCYSFFIGNISEIYTILNKYKNEYFFLKDIVRKKNFIHYKLTSLNNYLKLKNLYLKKIWSTVLTKYSLTSWEKVRKFYLAYSVNQFKFNKLKFLPKLSTILTKIVGKKIEYNIINLKSIAYHTDLFTNVLALKLKNIKNKYMTSIFSILNRTYIPKTNTIMERTYIKNQKLLSSQYKDLKIVSHLLNKENNLDQLLTKFSSKDLESNNIHNIIYNSIGYKNLAGIRVEVKGRLTKRYRADRSIHFMKWKGGLKNIDSSFKRMSSVLFRGNTNSNTSYSLSTGKRRIGAFAVKGWIGGK